MSWKLIRASRTAPIISKVTGIPWWLWQQGYVGRNITEMGYSHG